MRSATPYRPSMTFPQMCRWPPDWSITAAFDCHSRRRQHSALSRLSQRYLPEERDLNGQVQSEAIILSRPKNARKDVVVYMVR
jgi:hypothetical protein